MVKQQSNIYLFIILSFSLTISKEELFPINKIEVRINEICTNNKNSIIENYGNYSGWIELYNYGKYSLDLTGYGLSNELYIPLKWTFPKNTIIESGKYLIVFTSDKSSKNKELITNFELNKEGDYLFFSDSNAKLLEKIEIPSLEEDESYGILEDEAFQQMIPSPGKKNQKFLNPPKFSHNSGFYDENFLLFLSSNEESEIYYTIDGTNPLNSNTVQIYKNGIQIIDRSKEPNIYSEIGEDQYSPLSISTYEYRKPKYLLDKAIIIRVYNKNKDSRSKVISHTYFITTENLSEYKNSTIISIITNPENLFDPEKGIYVVGNKFIEKLKTLDENNRNIYGISDICNFNQKGEKWEKEADITIFEKGKILFEQTLGIRIKGASTRMASGKSFNLYARKKYGEKNIKSILFNDNYDINEKIIDKYKSFTLRSVYDTERIRDEIVNKLTFGREYQSITDTKKCILFINGEYWGFYIMMEKFSENFFENHYNIQNDDVMLIKENEISNGVEGDIDEYFNLMEKFSEKDLTDKEVYKELNKYLDIDSFIEYFVLGIYIGTWDWPNHNNGIWKYKGIKIKDNKYSDGKYRFFSFDFDFTMGNTYENFGGVEGYEFNFFERLREKGKNKHFPNYLFQLLLFNKEFKNKFILLFCDYINGVMNLDKINAIITDYKENYLDKLANGKLRWNGYENETKSEVFEKYKNDYMKTFDDIEIFFKERPKYTIENMKQYLNISEELNELTILKEGKGKIKVNSIFIEFKDGKWKGKYFNNIPVIITAISYDNSLFRGWRGDTLSNDLTLIINLSEINEIKAVFEDLN